MIRTNRRAVGFVLVLALVVCSAGCVGLLSDDSGPENGTDNGTETGETVDIDPPNASDVEPEALRAEVLNATADIETVAIELNLTNEMEGSTLEMETEGVMNFAEQKARQEVSVSTGFVSQEVTQYIVDETVYIENPRGGGWLKQNISGQNIWEQGALGQQGAGAGLGEATAVEGDVFDGNQVYRLEIDIDGENLTEPIPGEIGGGPGGIEPGFGVDTEYSDVELTQYVDAETSHVRHTEMEMTIETDLREQPATATIETTMDEFNEPLNIELPEEAADATRIGGPSPLSG
jgi:hypothetical protein